MQINSFAQIIWGKLLNSPSINSFENFAFEAKSVKRGDLFFALNEEEIESAIINGAYCIVLTSPKQIKDDEIAWIKVEDVKEALVKYLRYYLLRVSEVYYFNEVEIGLLKEILVDKSILILQNSLIEDFKAIIKKEYKLIISSNKELLRKIKGSLKNSSKIKQNYKLIHSSLFKSTISYNNKLYKNMKIVKPYLSNLFKVMSFCEENNLEFNLDKLNYIDYFYPVYINDDLEMVDFGKSQKVLIFTKDGEFLNSEIEFLKQNTKWAKSLIYKSENSENAIEDLKLFCKNDFNFAIVVGEKDRYFKKTNRGEEGISLFL